MKNINLAERKKQLLEKLESSGIADRRVLTVMAAVPRELFLPAPMQQLAYEEVVVPLGSGVFLNHPWLQAYTLQALNIRDNEKVLEIGTGSGYQTALLAGLADRVWSTEANRDMGITAFMRLRGFKSKVTVVIEEPSEGLETEAPFDVIISAVPFKDIPESLVAQLRPAGRMLVSLADGEKSEIVLAVKTLEGLVRSKLVEFQPVAEKPGADAQQAEPSEGGSE